MLKKLSDTQLSAENIRLEAENNRLKALHLQSLSLNHHLSAKFNQVNTQNQQLDITVGLLTRQKSQLLSDLSVAARENALCKGVIITQQLEIQNLTAALTSMNTSSRHTQSALEQTIAEQEEKLEALNDQVVPMMLEIQSLTTVLTSMDTSSRYTQSALEQTIDEQEEKLEVLNDQVVPMMRRENQHLRQQVTALTHRLEEALLLGSTLSDEEVMQYVFAPYEENIKTLQMEISDQYFEAFSRLPRDYGHLPLLDEASDLDEVDSPCQAHAAAAASQGLSSLIRATTGVSWPASAAISHPAI